MDAGNNSKMGKGKAPRHSLHQIQQLEAFFKECCNPNESQRRQLSRELGLGENQIKFWFQNKRSQTKAQNDRMDNTALRAENERLKSKNLAFSEMLKNAICPTCDGHPPVGEEERKLNIQKLKMENSQMREEYERIANEITSKTGKPISHFLSLPPETLEHLLSFPAERFLGQEIGSSSSPGIDLKNSDNPIAANKPIEINENDKIMMIQNADRSLKELAALLKEFEPLWVMSLTYGGYVLNDGDYSKNFPKLRHLRLRSSRTESSKDLAVVSIGASDLVEMFLDARKWADLFPTIVREAKIIETLDTGSLAGSLNLMYVRTHIMSSLVAPREFVFLRYCQQLGPHTWLIMDTSYDCVSEIQEPNRTRSRRFPSGLKIESLYNGESKVTWVDHVEVDESMNHPLYRNLLSSVYGYGAKRWLSTLERMIERSLYSMRPGSTSSREHGEGINFLEGSRRRIMALSHRMVKDFCAVVSRTDRSDLLECTNNNVRMSAHESYEPGQPRGTIVAVSASLWLPLTFENLFNFLRDEYRRPEWDVMLNRGPVNRIASMSTGAHLGNCVSIMQPSTFNEHMLLLQENSIDRLGALVVFTTVDKQDLKSVMHGEDSSKMTILPCGFLISSDGTPNGPFGSLLTLTFQWALAGRDSGSIENRKASLKDLNTIVTAIIQKIKVALGCSELD